LTGDNILSGYLVYELESIPFSHEFYYLQMKESFKRKQYLLKNNTKNDAEGEVVVRIRIHRLFGESEPGSRFDDQSF
jgi:hypothetical protein